MENVTFPEKFCDIGGRSFAWVYKHRSEFVDFTLTEMTETKGLFRSWQNFCRARIKNTRES